MTKSLTYIEIDQDICTHEYGVSPCTASIGVSGSDKCYNTRKTCQATNAYSETFTTLRFAVDTDYLPKDIDAIPSILGYSVSPAIISLGENMGLRAQLTIKLKDHPWSDTGPGGDPYLNDRSYDAFSTGTFWGKWRARVQFLRGRKIRLITGELGQTLAQMEKRHFVVETLDGPFPDGTISIVAKDPLKLLDGDRSQAPRPSNGFLVADITAAATSFVISPSGIETEYPLSGEINIGGAEICNYTRSGSTFTITRAQKNTEAKDHKSGDRVQIVLSYEGETPAYIINDLMVNYGGIDTNYIDLEDWENEVDSYLRRVFSATIPDPTSVNTLISELIQQGALSIWWDDINQKIRLRVLREISTSANQITDNIIQLGSFSSAEQMDKRLSQVWLFFGQRNSLRKLDEEDNYRSIAVIADPSAEANYGSASIKKIFSRWIAQGGRSTAVRIGQIFLGRFKNPPRRFNFSLLRNSYDIQAAQGYQLSWWTLQDVTGAKTYAPIQVTRLAPSASAIAIEAEEQLFERLDPEDLNNRVITLDSSTLNFNLREAHDLLYPEPLVADTFTLSCYIETNVVIGSSVFEGPAFDVGSWPVGITIYLYNNGLIQGRGGAGGQALNQQEPIPIPGQDGSVAFYTRNAITIDNEHGSIRGGGGGGSPGVVSKTGKLAGGGGGGAGYIAGNGGQGSVRDDPAWTGQPGTLDAGGLGSPNHTSNATGGWNGGGPGQNGAGYPPGTVFQGAGAAGDGVDGDSYVTYTNVGTIVGDRIN